MINRNDRFIVNSSIEEIPFIGPEDELTVEDIELHLNCEKGEFEALLMMEAYNPAMDARPKFTLDPDTLYELVVDGKIEHIQTIDTERADRPAGALNHTKENTLTPSQQETMQALRAVVLAIDELENIKKTSD